MKHKDKILSIYFLSRILISSQGKNKLTLDYEDFIFNWTERGDYYDLFDSCLEYYSKKGLISYKKNRDDEGDWCHIEFDFNKLNSFYIKESWEDIQQGLNSFNEIILEKEKTISDIVGFSPSLISEEIKATKSQIESIRKLSKSNELLRPLSKKIDVLNNYLSDISKLNNSYLNIYKNLIIPIKEEGIRGVKVTTRWAIISIIFASLISILIGALL